MTKADDSSSEHATSRRMRRSAMLTAIVAIAPLCVVGVALTSHTWWEGLVIATGLLVALGLLNEWSLDGYPRRVVVVLIFTGAAWLLGSLTLSGPLGFVPFSLVGALLIARRPAQRLLLTVVFALGVGLVGVTFMAVREPSWALTDAYVLLPIAVTLFVSGVVAASERSWQLVRLAARANDAEAELAISHERMRFAGDLHDIQGHTLHLIKLKTALAQRLVVADPERAGVELGEIRGLVDDTIKKARELAYARHEIDFAAELENARQLFEAAGIAVQIRHDGDTSDVHPLLAHVVREATTNLLRHAQPTLVIISTSPGRVRVTNDGVASQSKPQLGGLARLAERVELAGGRLSVDKTPGHFVVSAELGAPTKVGTRESSAHIDAQSS